MKAHARIVLLALTSIAISSCAHPAKGSSEPVPTADASRDVVMPPQLLSSGGVIRLESSGGRTRGTVEVPIDAEGKPNLFAMRFIGTFSQVIRKSITEFIEQSTFVSATRNGVPVKGVFKMTFR